MGTNTVAASIGLKPNDVVRRVVRGGGGGGESSGGKSRADIPVDEHDLERLLVNGDPLPELMIVLRTFKAK
ncbi:MAG: hypothetical protein U0744_17960 [Gemmataceae bacterium]